MSTRGPRSWTRRTSDAISVGDSRRNVTRPGTARPAVRGQSGRRDVYSEECDRAARAERVPRSMSRVARMDVAENVAGTPCPRRRRQVRPAGPVDVRLDRGPVRPAQPPAEPEHRPALAAVHDPDRPARAGRARCSTAAPGRPTWPWPTTGPAGAGRRSSAPTSATRCSAIGNARSARRRPAGRVTLIEGDTQRLPLPDDTFGVVTVAFGLRNVPTRSGGSTR